VAKLMGALIADGVEITVGVGFSTTAGNNTVPIGSTLSSITYTDVSTYVRSVQIKRGRSSELDDFTTGSCQIMFSNEDRRFDPENSAGPYYGELTPGRPIRIQATAPGGSAQTIFQGYVDQWDQQYTNPSDAIAVVTASDAFKVLNLITLPSYWEYQVREDGPTAWFRFDDGDAPTRPFETISGRSVGSWKTTAGAATTGASTGSLVANDSSVSAVFDGTDFIEIPIGFLPFDFFDYLAKTVECWISTSTTTDGKYGIFYKPGNEFTLALGMVVTGGVGVIQGQIGTGGGVNLSSVHTSSVHLKRDRYLQHDFLLCGDSRRTYPLLNSRLVLDTNRRSLRHRKRKLPNRQHSHSTPRLSTGHGRLDE
jgi:hypothetical protein